MRVNMDDPAIRMSEAFWAWFLRGKTIISIILAIIGARCWWTALHTNATGWHAAGLFVGGATALVLSAIFALFWLVDIINDHRLTTASVVMVLAGIGATWYSHPLRNYPGPSLRGYVIVFGGTAFVMGVVGLVYSLARSRPATYLHQQNYPRGVSAGM